jgi:protein-S-isoprenylcysteine O-methyltransferase Ste14
MPQLWQQIVTGQAKSITLLVGALVLFAYFLPSVVAFARGHRRFWPILICNILLTLVQSPIFHFLFPGFFIATANDIAHQLLLVLIVFYGPGWVALMAWALAAGEPNPRLLKARETKYYDVVAALPLILWFAYGALQIRPILVNDMHLMGSGAATLFTYVQFVSLALVTLFDLLLIYLLVVRDRPVAKSKGVLPRAFGFIGTFFGVSILQLPVAHLSLGAQIVAALLVGLGSLGSFVVLWRLGKSFSIMPEARRLVTGGPYALARHPLYTVEMVTICGTALQFQAPWSWVLAAAVLALLWIRSHYEEQVLEEAYPEYGAYRARTKRFIPGII